MSDYRPPGDWRPPTRPWVWALVWLVLIAACLAVLYVLLGLVAELAAGALV